jgi:hypothetical protein
LNVKASPFPQQIRNGHPKPSGFTVKLLEFSLGESDREHL